VMASYSHSYTDSFFPFVRPRLWFHNHCNYNFLNICFLFASWQMQILGCARVIYVPLYQYANWGTWWVNTPTCMQNDEIEMRDDNTAMH
jgi:hypothetical protein